ncbi:MAG TPA: pyrroline-5-carboxylate reductase [Firmicutes bacterium]|nr:pyrroline-5-carboxylate reductase [Bacillota bacterium]
MSDQVGIIGIGAMGNALLKGLLAALPPDKLMIADALPAKLQEARTTYKVPAADSKKIAAACGVIFLAVKPQDVRPLLQEMAPVLRDGQLVVSVAAGITLAEIKRHLPGRVGVVRVMPNTPCLVGEGALAVSAGDNVSEKDLQKVVSWLEKLGMVRVVPETALDAVTGLSGSGPAYVFLLIEALADGGVLAGLPRSLAQELAVQTVLGAAKLVRETGSHPAVLREMVTSPGGTTASGLFELEQGALRSVVQRAVKAACNRAKELAE